MVPPDFRSKALKKSVGVMDRGFGKGRFSTAAWGEWPLFSAWRPLYLLSIVAYNAQATDCSINSF